MVEASVAFPVGFDEDGTGRSKQHPERWWRAFTDAVEALAARSGLDGLAAVVPCGATRTQVFLDARGRPVRPAIGFRDTRAHRAAEQALHLPGVADHPEAKHLDRFHPLTRLLWLRETEPDAWAATRTVLEPKDWLVLRLTGEAASDPISQERLAAAFTGDQGSLAALAGIDRAVLPPLRAPHGRIGTARTGLGGALEGLAGVPVFCGSHDTWCAVAGLGALASGCGYCVSGSSETAGLLGPPERRVMHIVPAAPSDRPLVFHPYLNGERTPYRDADLRGALLGLDRDHGPGDIARAVMEGVALLNREVLERAGQAAGVRAERGERSGGALECRRDHHGRAHRGARREGNGARARSHPHAEAARSDGDRGEPQHEPRGSHRRPCDDPALGSHASRRFARRRDAECPLAPDPFPAGPPDPVDRTLDGEVPFIARFRRYGWPCAARPSLAMPLSGEA